MVEYLRMVLRWEPYISRYMIAYLALLCPAIGMGLDALNDLIKPRAMQSIVTVIYFLCAVELIVEMIYCGQILPENGGDVSYFAFRGDIYGDYEEIVEYINETECSNIGICIGGDSYEYGIKKKKGVEWNCTVAYCRNVGGHIHNNRKAGCFLRGEI